ncbi:MULTISPECIES: hypothetical protein [Mycobacterium]|uniref:hypothetical protein n=1 Tax=Mycobacterium TaxID=1763 RepID=UPI001E33274E|nr:MULTISPECIES: hypothetical protein [Mycobacterium]
MPFEPARAPLKQKLRHVAGGEFVENAVGFAIAPIQENIDIGDHSGPFLLRPIQPAVKLVEQRITRGAVRIVVAGIEM